MISTSSLLTYTRLISLILMLTLCADLALCQQTYSSQSILQERLQTFENTQTDINSTRLPSKQWIEKMEFRTEFNELDLEQQEYTFRLSFKNDKLRQQQNKLFKMQLSQIVNESRLNLDDHAQVYYDALVGWYFMQKKQPLYAQKARLIRDKNKLEMALFRDDQKLNFNDVLKVNDRLKDIELQLYTLSNDKFNLLDGLDVTDTSSVLNEANWISLSRIKEVIEALDNLIQTHPDIGIQDDKIALLNQEYVVEEKDVDNILDFAQIRYQVDDKLPIERELSLGVSIVIPYKQVNQAKLTEIEIQKLEQQIKQKDITTALQAELDAERTELLHLLQKHDFLTTFIADENLILLKSEYLASDQVAPLPLLNLELMIMDRNIELLELEEDIYLQYINTLDNIDALRLENNVNYLDGNLAPIR